MKILIGVCGIGKGHSTRQLELTRELLARGHDVRITTFGNGVKAFKRHNICTYEVFVPFIKFKGTKFDYVDILKQNYKKILKGSYMNHRVFKNLKREHFIPDICITDYEPTVAKFAYKHNIPLINIDQQSKFIYMTEKSINGYSCVEEKKRLNYFFPKCQYKYIVSFYKIGENLPENVKLVPPIIKNEIKKSNVDKKSNIIVVYFSKYGNISIKQSLEDLIDIFSKFTKYRFIIYTNKKIISKYKNVKLEKINEHKFAKDLGKCSAVITTAGHTLISESYFCKVPVYAIPLPTFDQHYCGKFIVENNLGMSSYIITQEKLKNFFYNLPLYKNNIETNNNLLRSIDTITYLADEIESLNFKNKKFREE